MEEKILTLHPKGKSGRTIDTSKYMTIKYAIIAVLKGKELTHDQIFEALDAKMKGKFDGNVFWYGETVKLDLEARGLIKRDNSKPQKYSLV